MKQVSLLRHGETTAGDRYCGHSDVRLSPRGWLQLCEAVEGRRWERIISSPLRRCAEFARLLAQDLDVPCEVDERLRELHFGEWEGRSAAELQQQCPEALGRYWQDPATHTPPGAETLAQLRARVLGFWGELAPVAGDERVLVIAHGGPIRILIAEFAGLPGGNPLQIEVPHAQLIDASAWTRAAG